MSGFIWSALGNAVTGAGNAVGGMMMRDIEDQRRLAEEDRKEANYIKRLEEADRIKSERDAKREEELQQRIIRDQAAARTRAGEIGRARDEERLNADAARLAEASASIAGDAPSTTAEQFKEMLRKDPSLRDLYAKTGVVGRNMTAQEREFQDVKDLGEAAMAVGAHSSVINAYAKLRSDVLDKIKEDNRAERDRRREDRADMAEDRREREGRERADYMGRMAGAAETRANRPPSGGADPNKPATTADLQRQITAAQNSLAQELGVPKNDVNAEIASLRRRADAGNAKAKQTLETVQPYLDELKDANDRMLQFKRSKPGAPDSAPAPSGAASAPGNNRASSGTTRNYSNLWN